MIAVCITCGQYHEDKNINMADSLAICPNCGHAHKIRMLPLFIITGASGTGKSTLCYELMKRQTDTIALEKDIFWRDEFATPDDDYYQFRNLCLRVANNIQQGGKPVILCGTASPGSYEKVTHARYFQAIHYLALVCDDKELEKRLKARPDWRNSGTSEFIKNMLAYNQWYKDNIDDNRFDVTLLDTTSLSIENTVSQVINWMDTKSHNS